MTAWRRLRDWQDAGVWQQLHEALDCLLVGVFMWIFLRRVPLPGNDLVRCLVAVTGPAPARDPSSRFRCGSAQMGARSGCGAVRAAGAAVGNGCRSRPGRGGRAEADGEARRCPAVLAN